MSVRCGDHVGTGAMYAGMNREGRSIHRVFSFDDLTLMIHKNQIRSANLSEVHSERVDPKMIEFFGITRGDVASDTFVEPKTREQPECCGEHPFAMQAFFSCGGKHRRAKTLRGNCWCCWHLDLRLAE
jgi:hypothetical protein